MKNSIEIASLSLSSTGSRLLKYSITILLMVLFSVSLSAQDKKATLEAKKKKLLDEIEFTQKLLTKTKASKDATLSDLQALSKQIELRKKLIKEVEGEIDLFTVKINENVDSLKQKEAQLSKLKKEYSDAIVKIYKSQRFADKLLFVVNATSFSEALRRVNYLRKYATFRQQQASQIIEKKSDISGQIASIDAKKKTKEQLLSGQVKEKVQLSKTVSQKNVVVQSLKQKEKELQTKISKKQTEATKLDAQIEAIIKKEIELARLAEEKKQKEAAAKLAAAEAAKKKAAEEAIKKAKEAGKEPSKADIETVNKKVETPVKLGNTPEFDQLSSNFYGNKGKLPWPVEKGFISKYFGPYVVPGTTIKMENNGIDIRTDDNSSVRCAFEGKVVGILNNPTFKNAVIVSHGEYFTVYSKLASVNVTKGQKISTKQVIGTAYTDEDNITEVHLEVWKGAAKLNPSEWIYKK
ncbi:MAG TPA: peptidoglycan DD-metalloendopeptidase family protein [Chitinophagales bacterium]|nr:peptidoglycan DD-metalloendopeptidase family protein [Chitinophagales bacterium]HPN18237.1 peptidoglycan DD-metalloendopeptidase family protein [Chitinophagales bacterium]